MRRWVQGLFFALGVRPFLVLFIGVRVFGREHLPAQDPFILAANHASHLDAALLLSLFPLRRLWRVRPVAAAEYFGRNLAVSFLSRLLFNILAIPRERITPGNNPLPRLAEALRGGESLIVFPEGTRAAGETLGRFRAGIAHLVERVPGVPVVPVFLKNTGRALPKGEWVPVPFFCEVRIGAPLELAESREENLARLERAVAALQTTAPPSAGR